MKYELKNEQLTVGFETKAERNICGMQMQSSGVDIHRYCFRL